MVELIEMRLERIGELVTSRARVRFPPCCPIRSIRMRGARCDRTVDVGLSARARIARYDFAGGGIHHIEPLGVRRRDFGASMNSP